MQSKGGGAPSSPGSAAVSNALSLEEAQKRFGVSLSSPANPPSCKTAIVDHTFSPCHSSASPPCHHSSAGAKTKPSDAAPAEPASTTATATAIDSTDRPGAAERAAEQAEAGDGEEEGEADEETAQQE